MGPRGTRAGVTALIITASMALSGCGILGKPQAGRPQPSGAPVAASPSASPTAAPLPEADQCNNNFYAEQLDLAKDRLVDCTQPHTAETVYVGRFVGAGAQGEVPLLDDQASEAEAAIQSAAYLDCASHADKYLGHSWIHMLLELRIILPTDEAWKAGDRWYRCDLYQVSWSTRALLDHTGSLKAKWLPPVCVDSNKDHVPEIDCATKHPSEFVGGFLLPASLKKEPATDKELEPFYDKCWKIMASYLGVTSAKAKSLAGVYVDWQEGPGLWRSGRRVALCFTWTGKSSSSYVTGSAKGRKGQGL